MRLWTIATTGFLAGCQILFPIGPADTPSDGPPDSAVDGGLTTGCSTLALLADNFDTNIDFRWFPTGTGSATNVGATLELAADPGAQVLLLAIEYYFLTDSSFEIDFILPVSPPADAEIGFELRGADGARYTIRVVNGRIRGTELTGGMAFTRGDEPYVPGGHARFRIAHAGDKLRWEVLDAAGNVAVSLAESAHPGPGLVSPVLFVIAPASVPFAGRFDNAMSRNPAAAACAATTLVDDFAPRPDPGPTWALSATSQCTTTFNNQLVMTLNNVADAFCTLFSSTIYDLRDGTLALEILEVPPTTAIQFAIQSWDDTIKPMFVLDADGLLSAIDAATGAIFTSTPFDLSIHRIWRFRALPDRLVFETDGTGGPQELTNTRTSSILDSLDAVAVEVKALTSTSAGGTARFEQIGP